MSKLFIMQQWEPGRPIPSHPVPSRPIPSHSVPSRPVPSHPIPSQEPSRAENCRAWSRTRRRPRARPELQSLATPDRQARQLPARDLHGESREDRASGSMPPGRREARSRCMPIPAPCALRPRASGHHGIRTSGDQGITASRHQAVRVSLSGLNMKGSQREEHHGFGIPTGGSRENTGRSLFDLLV
jgi:hypothetical protein